MDPGGLALGAALVAYNNGLNLWHRFHGALYVPLNLAAAALLLGLGARVWGLGADQLGLAGDQAAGLGAGVLLGAVAASPLFLALRHRRGAELVADERIAGATARQVAYRALVRVPLGTAALEELAFRGVLFAVLAPSGPVAAAVWSGAAFGLWHIAPAYNQLHENGIAGDRPIRYVVWLIGLTVLATSAAGVLLVWLRIAGGGLAAPFALHATLNSLSTVAAFLAHRRTVSFESGAG